MSETEYREFVLAHPDSQWELHDGRLVEKPAMSWDHGRTTSRLARQLLAQLDEAAYEVRINEGRVRRAVDTVFIPDLLVVPAAYGESFIDRPVLAILGEALPLVVEIWSPSTGEYDIDSKVPVYQQRGDLEIWCVHPYDRTLTRWVRQSDGSYVESVLREGIIELTALSGVTIDLDQLFAR
jgi:Uma2 family endonuclease